MTGGPLRGRNCLPSPSCLCCPSVQFSVLFYFVFVLCFVPGIVCVSELSILDLPFGFLLTFIYNFSVGTPVSSTNKNEDIKSSPHDAFLE
jgi:hypothetical protein